VGFVLVFPSNQADDLKERQILAITTRTWLVNIVIFLK